ncbi:MAG: ABC transporter substrate-binding protein [Bacteroidota bacterium]
MKVGFMYQSAPFFCLLLTMAICCMGCQEDGGQAEGRPKVFHYNQPNNITSLDPAFAKSQNNIWAVDHLYNGLVQLDEGLNVRPCIAKDWEISPDGTQYTFHLRTDVYFHDNEAFPAGKGRRLLAKDVAYSLGRIIDTLVNSPGSWIFSGKLDTVQAFEALDDSTFVLRLRKPFRPMLGILTMQYCSVVPREAVEYFGRDFRSHPVGSGPFQLKRWLENQALFLIRNDRYFEQRQADKLPYADGIRVSFMGDRMTAFLELIGGKIDFISGLESSYSNELLTSEGQLQPKQKDRLQFLKSPYLNTEYLGINMQMEEGDFPLRDKRIRQALNYGFDRQQMLFTLRNSVGKPAVSGFTPLGLPSYDAQKVKGYSYQPEKARQLMAEAGFPNGEGLPPLTLLTNKDYLDICTFISRQWQDIGITVNIDVLESATLRSMMRKGQAAFFRASWIADYPDAESFLTVFYGKNPAPPNYTHFSSDAFDRLYEQALNENNDSIRYDLYQQMDRILVEEAPVIFLFYDETALFARREIEGLSRNAINLLSVKGIKKP